MFKKFLAGLTAIALSLGMVALTAGPASAHAGNITASAVCNPATGKYDVTYTLSWSNIPDGVTAPIHTRTDDNLSFDNNWGYPGGKTWTNRGNTSGAAGSIQWTESLPGTTTGNGPWVYAYTPWSNNHNGATKHDTRIEGLAGNCSLPDDTSKKVEVCHYNSGQGGSYTLNDVSVSAVLNGTGHGGHGEDIIPPFSYVKQGVPGSYPGQNWDAYGQAVYAADCAKPTATPALPTFTEAVCIAAGQVGQASYVIPATTGVKYTVQLNGAGGFVEKSANTYYVSAGTTVEVQAVALTGYQIGTPNYWSKTFANNDCIVTTTPNPATFSVLECVAGVATAASYTIPTTVGVKYTVQLNGTGGFVEKAANTYVVPQGTTVEVHAVALTGYSLTGTQQWSKTFATIYCRVNPIAPSFTSAVCTPNDGPGSYGPASYTIPATTGVQYQVRFLPYGTWTNVAAGTHDVSAGQYVEVRAVAVGDYVLNGTVKWTKNFSAPDCDVDVTPVEPTWTEAVCTGEQEVGSASYTIPTIEGVTYQRFVSGSWVDVPSGVNEIVDGTLLLIRAIPLSGYEFPGVDVRYYGHLFTNFDESKDCVVPQEPTFDPQECTAPGDPSQATYTIPGDTGVKYQVWDGDSWTTVDAGTYDVDAFPTEVEIRAVPKHGYHFLPGATTEWSFDFASAGDCIENAPVEPVVGSNQECVVDDVESGAAHYESGTITIPNTPNVTYSVDGAVVAAGVHDYLPGTYTISAEAAPGYVLTGVPDPWTVEILAAEPCGQLIDLPVVDPIVTFVQTTCSVSGSYTLAVAPAEEEAGVIWTVTGGLPNTVGTHAVTTAGTVTVTATPAPGYGFSGDDDGFMEWSFDFTTLPDDCLPTLALTGGAPAASGLGLSALLVLGGILLITARKRELSTLTD